MRKIWCASIVMAGVITLLGIGWSGPTLASAEKIVWRMASAMPEVLYCENWTKTLRDEINRRAKGRMELQVYWGGELGTGKGGDDLRVIKNRNVEMVFLITPYVSGDMPGLAIFEQPFLIRSSEEVWKLQEKLVPIFDPILLKDWNLIALKPWLATFPQTMMFTKKVDSLDDLKGVKIRALGSAQVNFIKALKGIPVALPFGEVYLSAQRGLIDGLMTAANCFYDVKLHEVIKYIVNFPVNYNMMVFSVNKYAWNELPKDLQKVVLDSVQVAYKQCRVDHGVAWEKAAQDLKSVGCEVYRFPATLESKISNLSVPIWETWTDTPFKKELLAIARETLGR